MPQYLILLFTAATGNADCFLSAGSSQVAGDGLPPDDAVRATRSVLSLPPQRACALFPRGAVRKL